MNNETVRAAVTNIIAIAIKTLADAHNTTEKVIETEIENGNLKIKAQLTKLLGLMKDDTVINESVFAKVK